MTAAATTVASERTASPVRGSIEELQTERLSTRYRPKRDRGESGRAQRCPGLRVAWRNHDQLTARPCWWQNGRRWKSRSGRTTRDINESHASIATWAACITRRFRGANMREQFRGHPHFERTARFCEIYDNPAFDPEMECAPLEFFEPMVRRVFASPKNSIYKDARRSER